MNIKENVSATVGNVTRSAETKRTLTGWESSKSRTVKPAVHAIMTMEIRPRTTRIW